MRMAAVANIGLLLVHGIGEQQKLAHLRETANELKCAINGSPGLVSVNSIDNTAASEPNIILEAVVHDPGATQDRTIRLHCYEVWWADLGAQGNLWDQFGFW